MIPTPHALRTDVSSVGADIASRQKKVLVFIMFSLSVVLCILPPIESHLRHNQWQEGSVCRSFSDVPANPG